MSSASFWTQIRWRLGSSDAVMNRINDLIQKQINANSEAQDVTVEEILNPIITLPSKAVMRDNLFQTAVRSITQGQIAYFPVDPDLDTMRLWILNEHGGRYLTDHSFMQNRIQLNGTDQTKLVWGNDDDGVSGDPIVNRLIDDQYVRVEDNPNVQIKDISTSAEGISIFLRLYIEYARSGLKFGKPNVLFSKIDNEQVDYGYAAYLTDEGAISFFVRHNRIEYSVATPPQSIIWTNINLPDYTETDYASPNYYTIANVPAIPDPTPYVDLCFTYNFTTHQMQIIRSDFTDGAGIIIASSATSPNGIDGPLGGNLKGWWKMAEGGPVGDTTPVNTISDLSANALHATAVNPLWETETSNILFSGNNAYVPIVTNTSGKQINNLTTAFTFAAWARIDDAQGGYAGIVSNLNGRSDGNKILVRNNGADTEVLWRGHNGTNPVDTLATLANANFVGDDLWHHYAVIYDGIEVKIFVDGQLIFSEPQTYTVASGTANMTLGWGSTNASLYHLTGSMQDALLYNVNLTDAQLLEIYEQGRPISYFPKWRPNPPTEPPPPSPNTNLFESVYICNPPTNVAERDYTRLHQITAVGLTQHYSVSQGDQQVGQHVDEDGAYYNNDPTYIAGSTGVVASYYDSPIPSDHVVSYLRLDSTLFGGEIIKSSSPLIGKTISKLNVYGCDINPVDAPATGNIVCKIKKAAGGTDLVSNAIQADDLIDNAGPTSPATGWQIMVFTFPTNSYLLAAGDKIQLEYPGGTVDTGEEQPGTPAVPPQKIYDIDPNASDGPNPGFLTVAGHYMIRETIKSTSCPFYGKVIGQISLYLAHNGGGGSGAAVPVGVGLASGGVIEFGRLSPSALPVPSDLNGLTLFNFTLPNNTHVMGINDYVYVALDGAWNPGSEVYVRVTTQDKVPGCNMYGNGNAAPVDYTTRDLVGEFYDKGTPAGPPVPVVAPMKVAIARATTSIVNFANQYDAPYPLTSTIQERSTNDLYMTVFVTSSTTANHLYTKLYVTGGPKYAAIFVNSNAAGLFGKKVTRATFRISRVGSPTGTLYCKIRKGDTTASPNTITLGLNGAAGAGLNVAGIDTNANPASVYSFENRDNGQEGGYVLAAGDRIMLELSGTSTSASYIQVARTHTVSTMDNVYMQTSVDNVTWTPGTASQDDVVGIVYIGGFDTPLVTPYHTLGWQNDRVSQKVISTDTSNIGNIFNRKITQVKVWLKRVGLATGQITCCIRDGTGALVTNINTVEASSVSDSNFVLYTFSNLNNTYPLKQNDRVSIEYSGGDINKHIQINTNLLNTYAFGGLELYTGTYALKQNHDLAGEMSSGGGATDPLARTRVAERVGTTDSALKLKKISRVRVWLRKQSNPLGNVVIRIRNSAGNPTALIGNIDAETQVTSDPTEYTVTSSPISVYALQIGDYVSVEYNGGDDSNFVEVMTTKTTDGFDGVMKTYLAKYDDVSWVNNTAIDLVGRMDEGGDTFTPSQEDVIIPPPAYTKDLCILAGGPPWSYIDHQTSTLTHAPSQLFTNAVMPDFRFYRRVLTIEELINIFTNRIDRAEIAYGEVASVGFFAVSEQ